MVKYITTFTIFTIFQYIILCSCRCHLFSKHFWYFKTESQLSWSSNSFPPPHPATTPCLRAWHSIQHEGNSILQHLSFGTSFFYLTISSRIMHVEACVRMSFLFYDWLLVHVMYVVYFAYAFVCRHLGLVTRSIVNDAAVGSCAKSFSIFCY